MAVEFTNWGAESWAHGANLFAIQVAGGVHVHVRRIRGTIALSALAGANVGGTNMRQALIAFRPAGAEPPANAIVTSTPPASNHSISGNWFSLNIKQMGNSTESIVFDYEFPEPLACPYGCIWLYIINQTIGVAGNVTAPVEAANTEFQGEVYFTRD